MKWKIREAKKSDLADLVEFQKLLAFESEGLVLDEDVVHKGVSYILQTPGEGHYYVVEDEDLKVVACFLILKEWSDWRARHVWWIHSVYVAKSVRRKGLWSEVYKYLQDQVRNNPDIAGLRLCVDKTNHNAIKTYEALAMDGSHYHLYEWMK